MTKDDHIIVTEYGNNRLLALTQEGSLRTIVGGTRGSQPLQFDKPWGVAVDHNGKIFVTDFFNHRIQVLNADFTFSHCFGSNGAQPGEFSGPTDITVDSNNIVYVADLGNDRVQKFTPEGKVLGVINSKVDKENPQGPWGVCVDGNGMLYTTNRNTVSMFSSDGNFLGFIHDKDLKRDYTYIVSDQTTLYITGEIGLTTYNKQ